MSNGFSSDSMGPSGMRAAQVHGQIAYANPEDIPQIKKPGRLESLAPLSTGKSRKKKKQFNTMDQY